MDGIVFAAGIVLAVVMIGVNSRRRLEAPGLLMGLALVAASFWYVYA